MRLARHDPQIGGQLFQNSSWSGHRIRRLGHNDLGRKKNRLFVQGLDPAVSESLARSNNQRMEKERWNKKKCLCELEGCIVGLAVEVDFPNIAILVLDRELEDGFICVEPTCATNRVGRQRTGTFIWTLYKGFSFRDG
jgi:hypothetical protein